MKIDQTEFRNRVNKVCDNKVNYIQTNQKKDIQRKSITFLSMTTD